MFTKSATFVGVLFLVVGSALAHDGRRFEVQVINGQLYAQGYISGTTPVDDGNGIVRPYLNAVHAHWAGSPSSADLPGYDIEHQEDLEGYTLNYTVTGGTRWNIVNNPTSVLEALDPTEMLQVIKGIGEFTNTDLLGSIQLFSSVPAHGHVDLTFDYNQGSPDKLPTDAPLDYLYVLEGFLSTDAPGIASSGTIYTIFAPMGMAYHPKGLALESFLGQNIPEPASVVLLGAGMFALAQRRRRA
ncbi:MAG: PEP-CTERM sorting domain-containing protein [Phycisphaera sp.]|nr:PEP-CTERM sorting domain-containing protein [Phycisphaera sp.]